METKLIPQKSELEILRAGKDRFFKTDRQSPLTSEQKHAFTGLSYFPENPDLRFELPIEELPEKTVIEIQTSTGDIQRYKRWGKIHFPVEGQQAELTIFADETGFFLPFADKLAGIETYGAGRYLEPEELPDGRVLVDFNLAYNPYCAYNENFSCPLTPFENRLKLPIRAGEKLPEGKWAEHE
jgi:uncharacterized protein